MLKSAMSMGPLFSCRLASWDVASRVRLSVRPNRGDVWSSCEMREYYCWHAFGHPNWLLGTPWGHWNNMRNIFTGIDEHSLKVKGRSRIRGAQYTIKKLTVLGTLEFEPHSWYLDTAGSDFSLLIAFDCSMVWCVLWILLLYCAFYECQ